MARTVDHIERISNSFDTLTHESQRDIVIELFSRLLGADKSYALSVMQGILRALTPRPAKAGGKESAGES